VDPFERVSDIVFDIVLDNVAFGSGAAVAPSFAAAPPTARGGFHELNFVGRTFTDLLRCSFVACLTMSSLTSSPARALPVDGGEPGLAQRVARFRPLLVQVRDAHDFVALSEDVADGRSRLEPNLPVHALAVSRVPQEFIVRALEAVRAVRLVRRHRRQQTVRRGFALLERRARVATPPDAGVFCVTRTVKVNEENRDGERLIRDTGGDVG
jgi:hypothetical protein